MPIARVIVDGSLQPLPAAVYRGSNLLRDYPLVSATDRAFSRMM
jgi:hypothetical protein